MRCFLGQLTKHQLKVLYGSTGQMKIEYSLWDKDVCNHKCLQMLNGDIKMVICQHTLAHHVLKYSLEG